MIKTEFSEKLAQEIVKSWARVGSNYILVAPPLSDARSLLRRICGSELINLVHGSPNYQKFCVAELDTNDFKDDLTFAKRVLQDWKIPLQKFTSLDDAVSLLNHGAQSLIDRGQRPIIVVHRFHEALTKLGEDIGTALRNLEHDYNLCTVVELPVSITCLRERWETSKNVPPFLASDWGQGHSIKFVKGLTNQEIEYCLPESSKKNEMARRIYAMTAGLPGLVEKLLVAAETRDPNGLASYAKSQASNLCSRLVDWIDKPNDDFFKRLLVKTAAQSNPEEITKIKDHDWRDLFKEKESSLGFQMLVWACNNEISRGSNSWYLQQLRICFSKGTAEDFNTLLDSIDVRESNSEEGKYALALIKRFADAMNPFDAHWSSAKNIIDECRNKSLASESESLKYLTSCLDNWVVLCDNMNAFLYASERTTVRLEQFSLAKNNSSITYSLVDFLEIRLNFAKENLKPYLAMKAVVEIPEIMLQIYCYLNCGVCFWDFDGGKPDESMDVSAVIKMDFKMPKARAQLGFFEMLCLTYSRMKDFDSSDRLFDTYDQFSNIQRIYDDRKRQVHSTALIEKTEWFTYEEFCRDWLKKIKKTIGSTDRETPQTPGVIFNELLRRLV